MHPPDPILDPHELQLIEKLTNDYKKFTTPSTAARHLKHLSTKLMAIAPPKLRQMAADTLGLASEWAVVNKAMEVAGRGFGELTKHAARFTLSEKKIIEVLHGAGIPVDGFEAICTLRSYHIERIVTQGKSRALLAALAEGTATGAPGLLGVPFNLALSFLLYFRAVQNTALYYGYEVKNDPRELEFASETTLLSLAPTFEVKTETLGGLIRKMMLAAHLPARGHALPIKPSTEMAKGGGAQLLYVQLRALANHAAEKALREAGKTGLEARVVRTLLEQVGRRLPKEVGKKAVPLVGAVIGGVSDMYAMSRVLQGANLIYHKRFLLEKHYRVTLLSSTSPQDAPVLPHCAVVVPAMRGQY